MSSNVFSKLHKRMTITYSLIFGIIVTIIVFAAYALTWWSLLAIEKSELVDNIIHEGEEWISSREAPVNDKELASGSMLAYFEAPDGKNAIINQLGETEAGKTLAANRHKWPSLERKTRLIRMHDDKGNHYRYLAGVVVVKDGDKTIGTLYMFKNFHVFYVAAERTLFWLLTMITVLFLAGGLGSYYLAGRSISPISEMYEKQKQFTADASHEMRTPLAVLKLSCQEIQSDNESRLTEFSQESIKMMEEEIDRMTRLTEDLMSLARGDSGKLQLNFSRFDFSQMFARVVQQMRLVAIEKKINIEECIQDNIDIFGDTNGLNRLIIILLDNAIKYSYSNTTINVNLQKDHHNVLFRIADQGEGISDNEKNKVFDRFYRVDKARSRGMGGLGLGLSLAKAIVEEHNGEIWIEDNPSGQGSIFCVRLPYRTS